eukprot:9111408-Lingulodinium_polyedra.AAC.1
MPGGRNVWQFPLVQVQTSYNTYRENNKLADSLATQAVTRKESVVRTLQCFRTDGYVIPRRIWAQFDG